jgi:import inner membrane translocase subunit TIM10
MSFLGFGGAPQPTSAQKLAAAEQEIEMYTDMFTRLSNSCTKKCIPPDYKEGELNKGESVCLDRCVAKFFDVNIKVRSVSSEEDGAGADRRNRCPSRCRAFRRRKAVLAVDSAARLVSRRGVRPEGKWSNCTITTILDDTKRNGKKTKHSTNQNYTIRTHLLAALEWEKKESMPKEG